MPIRQTRRTRRYSLDIMKLPDGRKLGLKEDKPSRIIDRCDPVKSVIEDIPEQHWDELANNPIHVNERAKYRYTLDQDGNGSCAAESMCGTKAACDTRQNLPTILYNPLGTYYTTSGGRDNGSVIGENLELGRDQGCFPEEVWPRSKGFRAKPTAAAVAIAKFFRIREFFYVENIKQFVSALLQGFKIHFGYAGHAVSACRYLGRKVIEFKNSWGAWGDNGFGELSLSKVHFPYGSYAYKDSVMYANDHGDLGNWVNGIWTPCPWKPKHDQAVLAQAVMAYQVEMTKREKQAKRLKKRSVSGIGDEALYQQMLSKYGLAV